MSLNLTLIDWVKNPDGTQGYTWNPITGCLNHTPEGLCLGGMFPCYAYKLADGRLKPLYLANEEYAPVDIHNLDMIDPADDPFYPRFWEDRLIQPLSWSRYGGTTTANPKGIFVCDMGELFGDWIPSLWQEKIFEVIHRCPQHRFYLLTKQPQNLPQWSPFPDNCWVGVTATDAKMAFGAEDYLAHIEAKVKYISFEPLLSRVENPDGVLACLTRHIDWVIIGAQTKPYKPPKIEWVEEIVEACDKAGIPVFLKANLMPLFDYPQPLFFRHPFSSGLRQELPKC